MMLGLKAKTQPQKQENYRQATQAGIHMGFKLEGVGLKIKGYLQFEKSPCPSYDT